MTKNGLKPVTREMNMLQEVSQGLDSIYMDLVALNKDILATYRKISQYRKKGRQSYVAE